MREDENDVQAIIVLSGDRIVQETQKREPLTLSQRLQISEFSDSVRSKHEGCEVGTVLGNGWRNAFDSISSQEKRSQSSQTRKIVQLTDVVICEIYRIILVLDCKHRRH